MLTLARFDVDLIRREFPILATSVNGKPLVYLDNAATTQNPKGVIDGMTAYWEQTNANIHRGVHYLSQKATSEYDQVREKARRFLNARSTKEVIFTKGTTDGINIVAATLFSGASASRTGVPVVPKLGEEDEILVSNLEHHSNIVPWQMLADRTGAAVKVIPITDSGEIDLSTLAELLGSGKVRLVAVAHVSNSLGTVNPVKQIIEMAHNVGALVLVDGAQAVAHLPVDVQDMGADFYVFSTHKLYGPTGLGVLFGKQELLETMPPYQGGGDMIRTVSFTGTTYASLPAKLEAGTPPIAEVIGFGAALDFMNCLTWGDSWVAVEAYERELLQHATDALKAIDGVTIVGTAPVKTGVLSFVIEGVHPHDIGTILDNEGIAIRAGHHCCMPVMVRYGIPATARASFAAYNTHAEVVALANGVKKVKELFA